MTSSPLHQKFEVSTEKFMSPSITEYLCLDTYSVSQQRGQNDRNLSLMGLKLKATGGGVGWGEEGRSPGKMLVGRAVEFDAECAAEAALVASFGLQASQPLI
jgi:hypothetical protein